MLHRQVALREGQQGVLERMSPFESRRVGFRSVAFSASMLLGVSAIAAEPGGSPTARANEQTTDASDSSPIDAAPTNPPQSSESKRTAAEPSQPPATGATVPPAGAIDENPPSSTISSAGPTNKEVQRATLEPETEHTESGKQAQTAAGDATDHSASLGRAEHVQRDRGLTLAKKVGEPIEITVQAERPARYRATAADFGPLGVRSILDTPLSIHIVPSELIIEQDFRSPNDLVRLLPSAQIEARGSLEYGRPQTRGFESDVTGNVRFDGFTVMAPTAQPVEMYERLEVLYGPASALYGAGSAAGQFNAVLKRPTERPLRRLHLGYTNDSTFTVHADLGGRVGDARMLGYRANLVASDGEGYVDTSTTKRRLLSLALDARLSKSTTLDLVVSSYVLDEKGLPSGFAYGSSGSKTLPRAPDPTLVGFGQPFAGIRGTSSFYQMRARHSISSGWNLTAGVSRQQTSRDFRSFAQTLSDDLGNYRTSARESADRQELSGYQLYAHGRLSSQYLEHHFEFGFNGYYMRGYAGERSAVHNLGAASLRSPQLWAEPAWGGTGPLYHSSSTHSESVIAGYDVTLAEKVSALAVGSMNWIHSNSYPNPSASSVAGPPGAGSGGRSSYSKAAVIAPTFGVTYKPLPLASIYGNYGSGIQQGPTAPSTAANARETLPPIRSEQYEVGMKVTLRTLDLFLAAFRIERPFAFVDPADGVYKKEGQQVNYGVELNLTGRVARDLIIFGGVTFLDPRLRATGNPSTADKLVVGVPHWQSNVLIDYELPLPLPLILGLNVHLVDERAANDTNSTVAREYATIDTSLRHTLRFSEGRAVFRCGVRNLLDERYWTSLFPGSINGDAASYTGFVGAPRTYEASVRLEL